MQDKMHAQHDPNFNNQLVRLRMTSLFVDVFQGAAHPAHLRHHTWKYFSGFVTPLWVMQWL
jgi:hypothetical protein